MARGERERGSAEIQRQGRDDRNQGERDARRAARLHEEDGNDSLKSPALIHALAIFLNAPHLKEHGLRLWPFIRRETEGGRGIDQDTIPTDPWRRVGSLNAGGARPDKQ